MDACVWGHAVNEENEHCRCSMDLLMEIEDSDEVVLILDDEDLMLDEYYRQIKDPSYPQYLLAELLSSERTEVASVADLHPDARRAIKGLFRRQSKTRDHKMACIAVHTHSLLVTNDYEDFTDDVRRAIRKLGKIRVADACQAPAFL